MRFRLKTDFLTYARDQIRGGIWYKPAWWDAVHRVPPTAFTPRVKKRDIPHVRFIEDKLIRDFSIKNPMIAQYDGEGRASTDPRSVASTFAHTQMHMMKGANSEANAYALAKAWLIENGPSQYGKLAVPPHVRAAAEATPESVVAAKTAVEAVHEKQYSLLTAALERVQAARGGADHASASRKKPLPPYRSFYSAEDEAILSQRGLSEELVMPSGEAATAAAARKPSKELK